MSFSFKDRQKNIERLKNENFDLVVVGGGITGAGVARDAASRGLKVAVVEARDFAEGTSSRSSKLIHGGVRYLENFEFGLVFEALSERALLFKMAPHLVHPLRFLIPIYKHSRVSFWKMLAGMWLYDLLALFETPQMHESLGASEVISRIADINDQQLTGAVEYSDAYTDDDRLVIETLRDAHRMGAVLVNHVTVESAEQHDELISSLSVKDLRSQQTFMVKGDQYVSGVGPWTDIFGEQVLPGPWHQKLRPTKGVHLVFSRDRIPVDRAIVMAVEKRIIFVIPRHEMVVVGTTDTDYSSAPEKVQVTNEDVEYLIAALAQYFPGLNIQRKDIISSYCGVRPLVDDGSSSEGKTSREHSVWSHNENLTFVAGGKYTTYRKISQDVVDHVLAKMPFEKAMAFAPSATRGPLNPKVTPALYERAMMQTHSMATSFAVPETWVQLAVERHGSEAETVLHCCSKQDESMTWDERYWSAEAEFAVDHTMCLGLVDFYWRRSPLFLSRKDHGLPLVDAIASVFAKKLGWSDKETQDQKQQLSDQVNKELSWQLS